MPFHLYVPLRQSKCIYERSLPFVKTAAFTSPNRTAAVQFGGKGAMKTQIASHIQGDMKTEHGARLVVETLLFSIFLRDAERSRRWSRVRRRELARAVKRQHLPDKVIAKGEAASRRLPHISTQIRAANKDAAPRTRPRRCVCPHAGGIWQGQPNMASSGDANAECQARRRAHRADRSWRERPAGSTSDTRTWGASTHGDRVRAAGVLEKSDYLRRHRRRKVLYQRRR